MVYMIKYNAMIGNDDGINSIGLDILVSNAEKYFKPNIVAPIHQNTGKGKSMTFNKPIRILDHKTRSNYSGKAYDGSPADGLFVHNFFYDKPDLVLSGINSGENTSIHSILTSGTVGLALEAGLQNIPSFAFSMDVPEIYFFKDDFPGELNKFAEIGVKIAKLLYDELSKASWERLLLVNINFPDTFSKNTKIEVVKPDNYKYVNYLRENKDPSGDPYYWLWGDKKETFDTQKDSYKIYNDKSITISPISFSDTSDIESKIKDLINTKLML